jgi:peptidoglycan/LPS O-acetylase OafA/YrhL
MVETAPATASAGNNAGDDRYVFLDYLRACAAWLVVWDHLATIMPGWSGKVFAPAEWVRVHVARPLGIIQDFGWFGVALFFLISGFIISDRARVESARDFVIRRVLRIYPMLMIAVLLAAALVADKAQVTPRNILTNLTLANYLITPQIVLLGVAWTLVIEVMFYALTAVTQFMRDSPHRIALNLAIAALMIWKRGAFGGHLVWFGVYAMYLPILVMGQTIYWWLSRRRLPTALGIGYLAAAFGVFLWGVSLVEPAYLPLANSYAISVAYALMLFLALVRVRLPQVPAVRFLSDASYSLYLLHGIAGPLVLKALIPRAPLWVAIGAAAAVSLTAAAISYRWLERPLQRVARRLTRHPRAASGTSVDAAEPGHEVEAPAA